MRSGKRREDLQVDAQLHVGAVAHVEDLAMKIDRDAAASLKNSEGVCTR